MFLLLSTILLGCNNSGLSKQGASANEGSLKMLAPTPPMGWNSWNSFGTEVTEEQIKAVADYMAEHLKDYGWEYVVVDAGWYHPPTFTTPEWNDHPEPPQLIDEYGRLLPDPVKFPSSQGGKGFKPLADYVHSKGLKFGIHIMRGIPWNAVAENTPIKGTNATARDVVEYNNRCEWVNVMQGINMTHPAGYEYYRSILGMYADWGVDFIKADDMSRPYRVDEVHALSKAMHESGRGMVLSLSPGAATIMAANDLKKNAHMWRISNDFWDSWDLMLSQFNYTATWAPYIADNHWPDADMLPLGKLRKNGVGEWEAGMLNDKMENVKDEYSRFTKDEQYTVMNLWSIFKSPLMMGGYLPENDEFTLQLLTNADVLRVNQYSVNNRVMRSEKDHVIWAADDRDEKSKYIAIFNIGETAKEITATLSDLNLPASGLQAQDLWSKEKVEIQNNVVKLTLRPHASVLLKIYEEDFAKSQKIHDYSDRENLQSKLWERIDTISPLDNPHKGLYHHFYANSPNDYGSPGQNVAIIPGLKYLYLRLAWSFFEPEEGIFNWEYIDKVIEDYVPQGYKVAVCITSKETHPSTVNEIAEGVHYATPKWVRDAGAAGTEVDNWGLVHWEPEFSDPVYLEKLDGFVKELAKRYDGKSYFESVDIGSIGDWGEGHTGFSSNIVPKPSTVKAHIDIFKKHFKNTRIVLNDDFIYWHKTPEQSHEIRSYAEGNNLSFSEWSAMVEWWVKEGAPETYGIEHPGLFKDNYKYSPVTLECHHYKDWVDRGLWCIPDGLNCEKYGLHFLRKQILLTHATYVSFQGWPDIFIKENPFSANYIMNLAGYWYIPSKIDFPEIKSESVRFSIDWLNNGASVAYHQYKLLVKIVNLNDNTEQVFPLSDSNNLNWLPQTITNESYILNFNERLNTGEYALKIKMQFEGDSSITPVLLALKNEYIDEDGFYDLTSFRIN